VYVMVTAYGECDVDLALLSSSFDVNKLLCYNPLNLGKFVIDTFENTFNFCCKVNLIKPVKKCDKCNQELNRTHNHRSGHAKPAVFAVTITVARNNIILLC